MHIQYYSSIGEPTNCSTTVSAGFGVDTLAILVNRDSVLLHTVKCKNKKMVGEFKKLMILPDKRMKSGMLQRRSEQRYRSMINH